MSTSNSVTLTPVKRPVAEVVLLILSVGLCTLLVVSVIMVGTIAIVRPELDTSDAISSVGHAITVLVGAVVGFLAGRRSGTNRSAA